MGIWGYKLFEDDCALDVRDDFRDYIGDGVSPASATTRMVAEYLPEPQDGCFYASFWLALAATQWDLGRLTPLAFRRALNVIDRGIGLDEWGDASPRLLAGRRRMYAAIRRKLLQKQPPQKFVPRRYRCTTTWKRGYLVRYRCLSGKHIYLRVLAIDEDKGGKHVVADICDWNRDNPPPRGLAGRLPQRCPRGCTPFEDDRDGMVHLSAFRPKDFPADRVEVVARQLKFRPYRVGGMSFGGWAAFDAFLKSQFGIR